MPTPERDTIDATCSDALRALAEVRGAPSEDAARYEARLRFAAQCFDAVLQLGDHPSGERARLARAIMESHVAEALSFAAQAEDDLAAKLAA
jgi:hypothetical protein